MPESEWKARALKAELRVVTLQARLVANDAAHAEAFTAGAKQGRNEAFVRVSRNLLDHAERLASTGGLLEATCAKVLRKAAGNIAFHIQPTCQENVDVSQFPA